MTGINLSPFACQFISISFAVINGNGASHFSEEASIYVIRGDLDLKLWPSIQIEPTE